MRRFSSVLGPLAGLCLLAVLRGIAGPAAILPAPPSAPKYTLAAAGRWLMRSPDGHRFDASGLLRLPDGTLLTVNDKALPPCRIVLSTNGTARLVALTNLFAPADVVAVAGRLASALDCEGLARDDSGRIYVCEEGSRSIFRSMPGGPVERLPIDWSPVRRWFSTTDGNASFEGIAVGGNRLYVANERSIGRIIVVDLDTMKVTDDFQVTPIGRPAHDVHYSDLAWWRGDLWVLCRESRCVLRVDPASRVVKAEFDYTGIEMAPENVYVTPLPYGFFEGLSVDDESIWLAVDNNGLPRRQAPGDTRGLLFRCPRPDSKPGTARDTNKRNGVPLDGTP
jgi:hypothetical protein